MARAKTFKVEEKLNQAMQLFWRQGYNQTSLDDLETELSLKRFSIYNAFGDKANLYRQSLELYLKNMFEPAIKQLLDSDDIAAVEQFFTSSMSFFAAQTGRFSCFVCDASREMSPDFQSIRELTDRANEQLKQSFVSVLQRAISKGQLQAELPVRTSAEFLVVLYRGIVSSNCIEPDSDWMASVQHQLHHVFNTWRRH